MGLRRAVVCHLVWALTASGGCNALDSRDVDENLLDDGFGRMEGPAPEAAGREPGELLPPPDPRPAGESRPGPAPVQEAVPESPVFSGEVPVRALTPPPRWPDEPVDAAAVDVGDLASSCHHDRRGNRVCLLAPGTGIAAGPCAIDASGAVVVSAQVAWPDYRALPPGSLPERWDVSTVVASYDVGGELSWARAWHRVGTSPAMDVMPFGLAVDAAGNVTWAGQECVSPSPYEPSADGGYHGSCVDAIVASVDATGEPLWSWGFGTSDGLERVSALRLAPAGGLYLAGSFHGPLELPGHEPLRSNGGTDFFLMHLDVERQVSWARTWGSPSHDGNGVRIALSRAGDIAVSSNPGLEAPSGDGMLAVVGDDGTLRWERSGLDLYITRVAMLGDDVVTEIGGQLSRVGEAGPPQPLGGALPVGVGRKRVTREGTLIVATQSGSRVWELDADGELLREHRVAGAEGLWYHGGLCVGAGGEVAVAGTVRGASDFGILDEPVELDGPAGFALLLRDW